MAMNNLEEIRKKLTPLLKESGVKYAGVFGSVARGEASPNSDVDILVKFSAPPTFSGYLALEENLRRTLNRDVDLITEGGVNKYLRPIVERDLVLIYGQR
ncbi:MAG: hypothetical protein A2941_01920 [Candidatus Yanofskybacteria bacterium RIFCSPLOWO2_01_FULL_49_17]|uniref:Polymerase nucleotidyl transferase domain-containing protein n=1 Tax=Candidatus Yanofskybacteria bacterium RIFCSPLOWO2_01_FULL_49_17 TaxID=1802700 RepID=A0A1F8GSC4_9BACT|nr:MAG: hypothetical protein A2941_01920 [Candidatus Yanofskybacteria bacterium RIFCSPLOWO2_01_FULL_49_17]